MTVEIIQAIGFYIVSPIAAAIAAWAFFWMLTKL